MKKTFFILIVLFMVIFKTNSVFCEDSDINYKLNKFISNEIKSKEILLYIDSNYKKIENKKIKKDIINKVISYNEKQLSNYQCNFDKIIDSNVKNIQSKQNLKSEINLLNNIYKFNDICKYEFKFIDNKPILMKELKEIYKSGYKINIIERKFILKVNYDLFNKSY